MKHFPSMEQFRNLDRIFQLRFLSKFPFESQQPSIIVTGLSLFNRTPFPSTVPLNILSAAAAAGFRCGEKAADGMTARHTRVMRRRKLSVTRKIIIFTERIAILLLNAVTSTYHNSDLPGFQNIDPLRRPMRGTIIFIYFEDEKLRQLSKVLPMHAYQHIITSISRVYLTFVESVLYIISEHYVHNLIQSMNHRSAGSRYYLF